nr:MAG TPA: hypothetical protein [Inoviridae sp.]
MSIQSSAKREDDGVCRLRICCAERGFTRTF